MNKDQFARLARHRKVKQVLSDFAAAVAAVPAFAKIVARYLQQLGLLDGSARRQAVTSEGVTMAKSTAGTALIERLVKVANALYLFYKGAEPTPNLEEAAKMYRFASDYVNMTDLELATEAIDLSQRVTANKEVLMSDYNLSQAAITALNDDAKSFDTGLEGPQLAIDASKIKGATTRLTLINLNRFLKDDMRAGMELLKDTHEDAYKALREATQVDDAAYRKRKVKKAQKQAGAAGEASKVA